MIATVQSSWTPHSGPNFGEPTSFGQPYLPSGNQQYYPYPNESKHHPQFHGYAGFSGYGNIPNYMHRQGLPGYQTVYSAPTQTPATHQPVWNPQGTLANISTKFVPIHPNYPGSAFPGPTKTSGFLQEQKPSEVSLSQSDCAAFPANQLPISPETGILNEKDPDSSCALKAKCHSKRPIKQKKVQSIKECNDNQTKTDSVLKTTEKKSNRGRKPSNEPVELRQNRKREVNRISQKNSRAKKQKLIEDLESANEILQKADLEKNWVLQQKDTVLHQMDYTLQLKDKQLQEKDERIQWLENELNRLLRQEADQKMEHANLMNEAQALEQELNGYNIGFDQASNVQQMQPVNQVYHI